MVRVLIKSLKVIFSAFFSVTLSHRRSNLTDSFCKPCTSFNQISRSPRYARDDRENVINFGRWVICFTVIIFFSAGAFSEENLEQSLTEAFKGESEFLPNELENYAVYAELLGLDKITAKTSNFNLRTGETVKFGTLSVKLEACWKSAPDEKPESAALLEITENKAGEEKLKLFHGWMYQSSPSLNPLEHAVYDVTLIECSVEE